jgi:hypothetical protein
MKQAVAEHAESTIHDVPAAVGQSRRQRALVLQIAFARSGIDGPGPVIRPGDVRHPIQHQRCCFKSAATRHAFGIEAPLLR